VASIDAGHPWPWLEAFTEDARAFFNGRDDDVDAVLQVIALAPVTVLFGRSGLGKTSLLQAGVFPRLAQRRMFPVLLKRLDHGPRGAELSARWLARLDTEAAARGLAWHGERDEATDERARLWERLHRRDAGWRDAGGARWTPLLVLDQFEEVFTLESDPGARRRTFEELGDLLENRIPVAVAARIDADETLLDRLDLDAQPYRCLVALREDFLPELEVWTALAPRLAAQRLRLLPMDRAQALAAVLRTGGPLVDEASAQRIVAFLGHQGARATEAGDVEPALLSLVCASLNAERLERGLERLDVENLEASGARILDRFYDQAFDALPEDKRPAARSWVERELITAGGTRRPYPRRALAPELAGALETLVRQRLLRVENAELGEFVELVHDRLAAVAAERARLARERAEREAAERAEREKAARRRARNRTIGIGGAAMLLLAVGGLLFTFRQYRVAESARVQAARALEGKDEAVGRLTDKSFQLEAQRSRAEQASLEASAAAQAAGLAASHAFEQEQRAKEALAMALVQTRAATAFRLAAEGQTLASGEREGGVQRALLSMLAGYRLSQGTTQQARNAALAALQSQAGGGLVWVRDAPAASAIAISPDGKLAVTSGRGGIPELHDAATGDRLGSLPLAGGPPITALAFSPDGQTLVTGSRQGLRRWDMRAGRELPLPMATEGEVALVGFAGAMLVAASESGLLRLVLDGGADAVPFGDARPVVAAAISPDGRRIAVAHPDKGLEIFEIASGDLLATVIGAGSDEPTALTFSERDDDLLVAYRTGAVQRLDPTLASVASSRAGEGGGARVLRSLGAYLFEANADGRLRVRETRSLNVIDTVKAHGAGVGWSIALVPNGSQLMTVGADGLLERWALRGGAPGYQARLTARDVLFDPDGHGMTGAGATSLQRWTLDGRAGAKLGGPAPMRMEHVVRSLDGRRLLATGGPGGTSVFLLDAADGRVLAQVDAAPHHGVAAVSDDGRLVAVAQDDGQVRLFDGDTLKARDAPARAFDDGGVEALAFAPGSRSLFAGGAQSVVRWDVSSFDAYGQARSSDHGALALAISPDGRWLARAGADGIVRIGAIDGFAAWRTDGGIGHGGPVRRLAFSRDSQVLASAAADGHVRLWSVPDGTPLGQPILAGLGSDFRTLAFAPDARLLAAGNGDETRLWPVLDAWADADCAKLARNMTPAEWRDWVSPEIAYVVQCPGKPMPPDRPAARP